MARTRYAATFPAAAAGARVTWPNDVSVYLDGQIRRRVAEAYLDADMTVVVYSDAPSLDLTCNGGTLTVTSAAPQATGAPIAALPSPSAANAGKVIAVNDAGDGYALRDDTSGY